MAIAFSISKHEIKETHLAKVGKEGPFLGRKKKEEENGKAFYFQRSLSGDSFVILKTEKNDATTRFIVLYSI